MWPFKHKIICNKLCYEKYTQQYCDWKVENEIMDDALSPQFQWRSSTFFVISSLIHIHLSHVQRILLHSSHILMKMTSFASTHTQSICIFVARYMSLIPPRSYNDTFSILHVASITRKNSIIFFCFYNCCSTFFTRCCCCWYSLTLSHSFHSHLCVCISRSVLIN